MRFLLPLLLACLLSLGLETLAASLCPIPQADMFIDTLIARKLAHARAIGNTPKLVILAGSNGLFSHRCETIAPILGRPCVNASVAVGVGLDYVFARWKPYLHPGDVIYMPMEPPQFTRSRAENLVGPENRLLLHGQWGVLARLPLDRELAAMLSVDLPGQLRDLLTEPPLRDRIEHVNRALDRDFDREGDRVGHTLALAAGAAGKLAGIRGGEPDPKAIAGGYGARLIGGFVAQATAHGVIVVGGLATGFADISLPEADLAAMREVFTRNGGRFLELANRSRYPRGDFFDTRYHLSEPWQVGHSRLVAAGLRGLAP